MNVVIIVTVTATTAAIATIITATGPVAKHTNV
jgi:hypothetical protein